jgi:hypothetical protein
MNGAFHSGGPGPSKPSPIIINGQQNGQQVGTREKAQTLQVSIYGCNWGYTRAEETLSWAVH